MVSTVSTRGATTSGGPSELLGQGLPTTPAAVVKSTSAKAAAGARASIPAAPAVAAVRRARRRERAEGEIDRIGKHLQPEPNHAGITSFSRGSSALQVNVYLERSLPAQ